MPLFTLRITLDDASVVNMTHKLSFEDCKNAIQEMKEEGMFTLPSMSPVTFIPFLRVVKIELVAVV